MKKNNITITIFIAFLFLIGFFNLIQNGKTIINYIENKEIDIISVRDGSLFLEIEEEFSDNFIFKETFMKISNNLNNIKGISKEFEIIDTKSINVAENWTEDRKPLDIEDDQINENYSNAENDNMDKTSEEFTGEINENTALGSILIYEEKGMELNTYNSNAVENYVDILNGIAEIIDEVNIYSMLIPTQVEFIDYKKINEISYSQKKVIDEVYSSFINIETIDVYEILKENKSDYIFFKTDHHWTQLGAYYAYREFAETIEDIPKDINYFEKIEIENFLGSLHRVTGNVKLEENPDLITVYKDEINPNIYNSSSKDEKISSLYDLTTNFEDTNNKYGVFLGGDKALMYIEGKTENSKSIMVVKDSYGNAFVPFLINHYQYIYVVDPRLHTGNVYELIEKENIENILFLNYSLVLRYDGYNDLLKQIFINDI